jgi:hypothetical protein
MVRSYAAGDVDLAAFESEERRRLEAAIAQLSPDARRELIALICAGTAAVIELRDRLAAYAPHPAGGAARISHGHTARALHRRGASQAKLQRRVTATAGREPHAAECLHSGDQSIEHRDAQCAAGLERVHADVQIAADIVLLTECRANEKRAGSVKR